MLLLQIEGLDDRKQMRANLFGDSDSEDEVEEPSGKKALAALAARKRLEQQEAVRGSVCWWCPCCCCTWPLPGSTGWAVATGGSAYMRFSTALAAAVLAVTVHFFPLLRKSYLCLPSLCLQLVCLPLLCLLVLGLPLQCPCPRTATVLAGAVLAVLCPPSFCLPMLCQCPSPLS